MADAYWKFTGRIDRRNPRDEGDANDVVERENLLPRSGRNKKVPGTEKLFSNALSDRITWIGRYYTAESGITSPKSFAYTQDGKMWRLFDNGDAPVQANPVMNSDAYPKHWLFKTGQQTNLYVVDGLKLWRHDGNNDELFEDVGLVDSNDDSVLPIDVIEHKDRLLVISKKSLFVSKNLEPETFDDATDSLEVIIGSGKGENLAFAKIEEFLFIFNTEGIFVIEGDTISALSGTWRIRLVEQRNCVAGRSVHRVEKGVLFLSATEDKIELWSFDGTNSKLLSFTEVLSDFVNTSRGMLDKAVAHYVDNYYMVSVVAKGEATTNRLEFWWDAFEDKISFVRGRNVSCYMSADPTKEPPFSYVGRSDANFIMKVTDVHDFDGVAPVIRFRTKDIPIAKKGQNSRISTIYPEIEPTGERNIFFRYLLDGRLSNVGDNAQFNQILKGESLGLGFIAITNQSQFIDRTRPKINYARGTTIAFEIYDQTVGLDFSMKGIGLDIVPKGKKKGRKVSQ